ncbi:MAG: phosphoserine phosphatase SerB, partial [Sutterella wadsworthensis]
MNDMLLAGDDRAIHGFADRLNFRTKLVRPGFIRLSGVSSKGFPTGLAAMAEESAVDVLLLPPDLSLRRFRVACFDMDSTLIESECIDEMAAFAGAGERISRITRRAMEGLIPFDESLRQRVAALAGSSVEIVTHAVERAVPTPGALDFVDFLARHGLATYIITGGFEEIATHVARRFGMTGVVCNRLVLEDGRLTGGVRGPAGGKILDADGKRRALEVLAQVNGASLSETIAGGDGANDLQMIATAGFGFAYHGKPVVMREAPRG